MWIPKQFHFPEPLPEPISALPSYRLVQTSNWMEYCSKSMSNHKSSDTVRNGHNFQNDMHMSMPTIKCSLCKSSTPSKQNANQIDDNNNKNLHDSDDMYESIMLDMSNISSLSSDAMAWSDVQSHGEHCANRFIVRIFAQSK